MNIMEAPNNFGLTDCKPMNTPAAPGTKLYKTVPTGLLVYLHGVGPLYWKSQLQTVTATSTKESEYYSVGACARVLVGFRQLCHSLGFTQDSSEIQSDNQPALYSLKTKLSHSKSRHIKIQCHYVKDLIRDGEVHFKYCPTEDMVADLFTKALPASQFERLTSILYNQL